MASFFYKVINLPSTFIAIEIKALQYGTQIYFFKNKELKHILFIEKDIFVYVFNNTIILKTVKNSKKYLQLYYKQILNFIEDLEIGFSVELETLGAGLRYIEEKNNFLYFDLAYSHIVKFPKSPDISVIALNGEGTKIKLFGDNRVNVLNFAQQLRSLRSPSVYTGSGVKFVLENIKKKERKKEN